MMVMTEAPLELLDEVSVGPRSTHDGELLGQLVDMPTGAWLAVVLESVDPSSLTAWDMPAYLQAWDKVKSYAAAQLTAGIAQLAAMPDSEGTDKEVAFALREPVGAAQTRVWQAKRLCRLLPATFARFSRGDLSERHALAVVDGSAGVDDPQLLAAMEERVLPGSGGKTAAELRKRVKRVLAALDPAGAQRRARDARADADVALYPRDDGMSDVVVHTPVEDGQLVKTAVDAYAAAAKAAGDSRRIGVLRAEAVTGWASDFLSGRGSRADRPPTAGGRPIEIGIVLGLRTALGLDELPGEVPDAGIVPRDLVAQLIATELPRLRLLVIDEASGRLMHRGVDSYRPTAEQVAQVRAAWVTSAGPGSQVPAVRADTDHAIPHPEGPTSVDNLLPLDRTWHRAKTHTSLSVTINPDGSATWNTVLGQTRTVTPYDYRLDQGHPGEQS